MACGQPLGDALREWDRRTIAAEGWPAALLILDEVRDEFGASPWRFHDPGWHGVDWHRCRRDYLAGRLRWFWWLIENGFDAAEIERRLRLRNPVQRDYYRAQAAERQQWHRAYSAYRRHQYDLMIRHYPEVAEAWGLVRWIESAAA